MHTFKKVGKYFLWGILGIMVVGIGLKIVHQTVIYPKTVRKDCDSYAREISIKERSVTAREESYDFYYNSCFRQKGLEPEIN